ncbi:hypothetical protein CCMSSC00406_0009010 [Pleurotus cornucopiae]|uniref:Uncharacterized protein n=1 Tax=Pleurotus cornucopiae TaxID=5321 RepID=A0ACB7IV91_PLECO|nr:hypothetical protein CCMSSC00406_0009010 [Pleurotus cornucopiae]
MSTLGNISLSSSASTPNVVERSPAEAADQTLSTSTASLSFYAASLNMKDRRAYERERQRSKKTAELVKNRALKEQTPSPPGTLSAPLRALWARTVSGRQREHPHAQHAQPQDSSTCAPFADNAPKRGLSSLFTAVDDDMVAVDSSGAHPSRPLSPLRSGRSSPKPEVALVDLINTTSRVPRKSRKGKDGDFEFVPPVRSVIALDDSDARELGDDTALNEPWEHVYSSAVGDGDLEPEVDPGPYKVPSYAAVLATK